jgi:hypothetical protein
VSELALGALLTLTGVLLLFTLLVVTGAIVCYLFLSRFTRIHLLRKSDGISLTAEFSKKGKRR